jgi:hypothetical protein
MFKISQFLEKKIQNICVQYNYIYYENIFHNQSSDILLVS